MLMNFFLAADSVAAKGTNYNIGYYVGAWLPFIVLAIIATAIIIKKKKS
jgi:hypothetical protein